MKWRSQLQEQYFNNLYPDDEIEYDKLTYLQEAYDINYAIKALKRNFPETTDFYCYLWLCNIKKFQPKAWKDWL